MMKVRLYRMCISVASLVAVLQAAGAPRKWS
jgi:hypothetical protein